MIPKRVSLENFLSFGSPATEIVFADNEPLWVLGGPNGVGKSAVFDAITYCLFGQHRGGKQNADQLVRHGANGFKVEFEFEINGTDYRITRSRFSKTTQRVEQRNPDTGAWMPVPNVNNAADVEKWSEQTLGLGFDAFKASVLLRQGEADEIINATGSRRLEILKRIIDVERFEALSKRVHDKTWGLKLELDGLCNRRDGQPEVTDDQLLAAQTKLAEAEDARKGAQDAAQAAADRVTAAKRWVELDGKLQGYEKQLRDADDRVAESQHIRDDKARLDELTIAVPALQQIVNLRARLDKAKQSLEDRQEEANRVTAALKALDLRKVIKGDTKFIEAADDVANLKAKLDEFPPDLAGQLSAARGKAKDAENALTTAGKASATANGLLKQALKRQKEFDTVGVGVKCSRCGQEVTEEHAQKERDDITAEVRSLKKLYDDAETAEQVVTKAKRAADEERDATIKLHQDQSDVSRQLARLEQILIHLGVTADADELRRQLTEKKAELDQYETVAADQANVDRETLEKRKTEIEKKQRADEQTIAADQGKVSTHIEQLSATWQAKLDTLDADAIAALDTDCQQLAASEVTDQFKLLQDDAALRQEWTRQREDVDREIAVIPETARVPAVDAERDAEQARQAFSTANTNHDNAKAATADLDRQAKDYRQIVADIADAEKQSDLHKKLDGLLGKDGLQRELVRAAERGIVYHANTTVQNLSNGDLSIELEEEPDGADRAFTLQVRRADDPMPIPVTYLSGSQKFRVSVAVALAIGRYAAGQHRRLESVIIDEGFGSLDRDGLNAMADELHRLREHLKRIVLVSHQEEFADRFPVVIKLARGEAGTTAEAVRR